MGKRTGLSNSILRNLTEVESLALRCNLFSYFSTELRGYKEGIILYYTLPFIVFVEFLFNRKPFSKILRIFFHSFQFHNDCKQVILNDNSFTSLTEKNIETVLLCCLKIGVSRRPLNIFFLF